MFCEHRLIYFEIPVKSQENLSAEPAKKPDISLDEAAESVKTAAEIAEELETGDVPGAVMTFYNAYLSSAEKAKRYRDFMFMAVTPLSMLMAKASIPVLSRLARVQIDVSNSLIDKVYGVRGKVKRTVENNDAIRFLTEAAGQWDQLDDEQQIAVKGLLDDTIQKAASFTNVNQ